MTALAFAIYLTVEYHWHFKECNDLVLLPMTRTAFAEWCKYDFD